MEAPAHSTKSGSNSSYPTQFKYAEFSLSNSKLKFLRVSSSKTPLYPSIKRGSPLSALLSVSSEEMEHFDKIAKLEGQIHFEPLETDLNALFQCVEDLISEKLPLASRPFP